MLDLKALIHRPVSKLFDELLATIGNFSLSHEFEDDVCLVGMDFDLPGRNRRSMND